MLSTEEKPVQEFNETTETVKEPIKNKSDLLSSAFEQTKSEVKEKPVVNISTSVEEDEEMELLRDMKKKTDKDEIKDANKVVEKNADGTIKETVTTTSSSTRIQYANHELVARLTVAAISVGMGILLQFISDNWTEEGEKKYKISATQKQELLEPLTLVLEQSKAKYNPVVILVITVITSYVPLFIKAFREKKANKELEESKARKKKFKKVDEAEEVKEGEEEGEEENEEEVAETKSTGKAEKIKTITKTVEVFKMTKGQKERLAKIKSKRGARSDDDKKFIEEMGLTGIV